MEINKAAAPAVPGKEAAPAASCFKRTVGEDTTLMELAKDQYRQFTEAPAADHWACIKNKFCSMLADPIPIFGGGGAKDHGSSTNSNTPRSVESQ